MYISFKINSAVAIACIQTACVIHEPAKPNDPHYAPVMKTTERMQPPLNGSLYSENRSLRLFTDTKARHIGDIITVVLQERTSSSKSSSVEVIKDNELGIDPAGTGTIFGQTPGGALSLGTNLTAEREFTGEAEADQSNRLSGNISVTIVNRFPNGNLEIRGEKWVTLNRGDEFIRISGIIRPDDISPDNSITSNKIADARITYSGTGELSDSQQMGWLSRFFNSPIWPF